MLYVVLWFVIGVTYLLSMVLMGRCMHLGEKKYVKVTPRTTGRRWTERVASATTRPTV